MKTMAPPIQQGQRRVPLHRSVLAKEAKRGTILAGDKRGEALLAAAVLGWALIGEVDRNATNAIGLGRAKSNCHLFTGEDKMPTR